MLLNRSSWSKTNSSAPIDKGFFITSNANEVPEDITVIDASWVSLIWSAASTAFSSKPLTTGGILAGGTTCFTAESIWNAATGISGSITCLASTAILTGIVFPFGLKFKQHEMYHRRFGLSTDPSVVVYT